ncbi:alginate lyase family protein [Fodinibius sediminis]|uniref:Alginate lyase n=1 Tax=Fodinibius sediminis TaxID=1214077 RepID=A0A521BTI1_9BACT|nr:alginate lyase family protein [Fodinibius sediminis]SMO50466.1 Alginate lyase [Fodinibius sediminis]
MACGAEHRAASTLDLKEIEYDRVSQAADRYLGTAVVTVTDTVSPRSAGGPHDYYSEGDYWWPDPENPGGPYIRRDGRSNPDNFLAHRQAMRRLSKIVPTLVSAFKLTGKERYADEAIRHLHAWFIDEKTMMNPNLQYSQAIMGRNEGRSIGIIDTIHLVEVAQAVRVLNSMGYLSGENQSALLGWFSAYLDWLTTSKFGIEEKMHGNNHSTAWALQASAFARLVGNQEILEACRSLYKGTLLPEQVAEDGSFPRELDRTKPYGYSLFNLDVMTSLVHIISDDNHDLWTYQTEDGKSIGKVLEFMYPYIEDKSEWPYREDVMYYDQWPVRHPALLFGGLALDRPRYIALWNSLNPDPEFPEIVRNFPIRQPILWIEQH